jgi:predicted nucleic acid-binding protein
MIIKDAMVIIHLAKITLLEKSCDYFKKVIIPEKVHNEVILNEEKHQEIRIIKDLIKKHKLRVEKVKEEFLLKKANEFNIQGGEAESLALYWQEKADYLATDDDNVRRKSSALNIRIIGTPVLVLKLYKEEMIDKDKLIESTMKLKKIGWFSNAIIDKILMEAK